MRPRLKFYLIFCISIFSILPQYLNAQDQFTPPDSVRRLIYLPDVNVIGAANNRDVIQLPEIVGTNIYAGKKNSLVVIDNLNAIVVNNNMRQVMAKIPGIHIWESDGSGIQIGISARGLSPNRSWEFNIRQNGYDISSDPYGYPEAYYNPQMQAVQKIQVVRGAGALQYGPQFGGMVNYIMRDGSDIKKPFQFETHQTLGSFGLFNAFNAVGGKYKKIHYYAFYDQRSANGWRENSRYKTQTAYGSLTWQLRNNITLNAEHMWYNMESQQPGGLTDAQLATDPKSSSRARNWFATPWNTTALKLNWEINATTRLQTKIFHIAGDRSSVGYMKAITTRDTINKSTLQYNPREVAIDKYRNTGAEVNFLKEYKWGGRIHTLSAGIRLYNGQTERFQKGNGTTGTDANYSITSGLFPVELNFHNKNLAFFAEHLIRLNKKLLIVPGFRAEMIRSEVSGRLGLQGNNPVNIIPQNRIRQFMLGGVGAEYHVGKSGEFYASYTQAYRPILFSDLTQSNTTDVIDQNLKDSRGFNADFGFRGQVGKFLHIDGGPYLLQYNNRIGSFSKTDTAGNSYNYRTNIGQSISYGVECYTELEVMELLGVKKFKMPVFVSYARNESYYRNTLTEVNLDGKQVENAPKHILRTGMSIRWNAFTTTVQASHVSKTFSDAQNTTAPSANGQTGQIPAYTIWDVSAMWKSGDKYSIRISLNNALNEVYFTRRAGGYPGPGLMPADGRSLLVSVMARI